MLGAIAKTEGKLEACGLYEVSFFDRVDILCDESVLPKEPLHRFLSLMRKMGVRAILSEELQEDHVELKAEKESAQRRCGGDVALTAMRLTCFCTLPSTGGYTKEEIPDDRLLGYAVLVRLVLPNNEIRVYILESVVRLPAIVIPGAAEEDEIHVADIRHYYLHNIREFKTEIGTIDNRRPIPIVGSFFAQQNALTHVCAHACLQMAINSSPAFANGKLTATRINQILEIDFSSPAKTVGQYPINEEGRGLSIDQMEKVVRELKGRVIVGDFYDRPVIEYDHFIYPLMESGCPVIVGLQGWDARQRSELAHVVAVLGHTLNTDRWGPEARAGYGNFPLTDHMPAAEWTDHFVISDDNYGMYLTLPSEMVRNFLTPSKNPWLHAIRAVGIVPENVTLSGYLAEIGAVEKAKRLLEHIRLNPPLAWLERLKTRPLVSRTLLRSRLDYQSDLKILMAKNAMPAGAQQAIDALPEYVWVTELSVPQLYTTNKRKLGEVLVKANASDDDHREGRSIAFAWFPGFCFWPTANFDVWPITSHVPVIRVGGDPPGPEW